MKRTQRLLWASYLFLWVTSVPLLALDIVPAGGELMASVMLVLPASLCAWWLIEHFTSIAWVSVATILLASWAVEYLGVTTGWPFGSYRYTGVLFPALPGGVPLAIPFAWLLVVPGAMEVARLLLRGRNPNPPPLPSPIPHVLLGATLAMGLDMVIEPVAVYVNGYWTWLDSGPFYGIPTSNFVAWWVVACSFGPLMLLAFQPVRWQKLPLPDWSLPAMIYTLNLGLFTVVNFTHDYPGAGALGLAMLALGGGFLALNRAKRNLRVDT